MHESPLHDKTDLMDAICGWQSSEFLSKFTYGSKITKRTFDDNNMEVIKFVHSFLKIKPEHIRRNLMDFITNSPKIDYQVERGKVTMEYLDFIGCLNSVLLHCAPFLSSEVISMSSFVLSSIQNLCLYDNLNLPVLPKITNEELLFASCPYAGPIGSKSPNASIIGIYMQNGAQIASFQASNAVHLFWTKCLKLLVINNVGRILLYDALGKLVKTSTMGDETLSVGMIDAKIFSYSNETGLAIINKSGHYFLVNSVTTPLLWRIQSDSKTPIPSCWTVITSCIKPTRVLLCSKTRFLIGEQETSSFQFCNFPWSRTEGQYLKMELDHDQCQLLLLHDSKLMQLVDVEADDFQCLREINLEFNGDIGQILCGKSSFAIEQRLENSNNLSIYSLEESLDVNQSEHIENTFNSTFNLWLNFSFSSDAHFDTDIDGIRVFTKRSTSLLLPVQDASKSVLGLGSNEPGALLYGAAVKLEQKSHSSYEFIRSINVDDMPIAVDQCLSVLFFKGILFSKAASIGMRRCQRPYDADKFVSICRLLRVLNALRLMGIPLTFTQLEELTPSSVVDRLVVLGHWPMAIKLCEFLEINLKEGVYKNNKNKKGKNIAEMASRQELPELSEILLDLETNISRQVTAMLKLKQLEKALQKAAQSQQPDLMHLVLRHLRSNMSGLEVEILLSKAPQALSIYQSEIRDEAPERLLALYEQSDDYIRQALLYLNKAEQSKADVFDSSKTTEFLLNAEKALKNMKEIQTAQLIGENAQLINENVLREEKVKINILKMVRFGTSLSHLSVRDTFIWAVEHDELAIIDQLRKQHRLVDKQVFLWTIEGFAIAEKWQQLEQYVRSRKSPMGFLPIIELCTKNGNKNLAMRFMDKLTNYEEQVRAYLIMNEIKKAATLAAEKVDLIMLQLIRRRVPPTSQQWTEVTKIIENLARNK
ncbi:Vps16_N domain-containing protein [Meloidogyne graminicola]|uniref:Vacuolar protein sorting-associated protein 16 homolog n=1 Tax=Meloidogyne graminicola TaxID=189291 RepID=A0A8S9ZKM9_9BILA|nr:Vps16_N domain-containing protein [Meloidogyne graminicola]